ncbi:MAG: amidohydrolase [Bdellovibrionaceae bacterium]|nr:amidohydrolase [Pseudobdellovibrionaceae bacterium]MDW8189840.1 amidohydrolase [Pseudobdellovibrionaceae bacterium]
MVTYNVGIKAGYLVPMSEKGLYLENYFVGIKDGLIVAVKPFHSRDKLKCRKFFDFTHHIVLPGLINAHTHLAMVLFRGLEDDLNLQSWLFDKIFPLEKHFVTQSFVELGTRLAAFECIRFGTTCVADMYFYPEVGLKVWEEMGLRGTFGQPLISFPSPEAPEVDNARLFQKFETLFTVYRNHPFLSVSLAPHAPYSCDLNLLNAVAAVQKRTNCLVQIHLSETAQEVQEIKAKYNKSPVQFLDEIGLLNPRTICAHVVHTQEEDRATLAKKGCHVVHNPDSNFKLGSGIAPIGEYLRYQINVALGTDGAASNNDLSLFGALDLSAKGQKVFAKDISQFTAWDALWAATRGGAKALGLEHVTGQISEGYSADLIVVDTRFPHLVPISDPVSHLVYATQGLEVDTTIVRGRVLMHDKKIIPKGYDAVRVKAQKLRKQMVTFLKDQK